MDVRFQRKRGETSNILRFKIRDLSDNNGAGKTTLAFNTASLKISTICDNEATVTSYTQAGSTIETVTTLGTYAAPTATKCRFREVDATNNPGLYELQLADARFAVAGAKNLSITISGAADMAQTDIDVALTEPDFLQSGTAAAGGASTITLATALGANDLPIGCTIFIFAGTGAGQARTVVDYVNSTKVCTVDRAWTTAPDNTSQYVLTFRYLPGLLAQTYGSLETGTAQAGGVSTITLRSGASSVTDAYKYQAVVIIAGTGAGQTNQITGYNGSTKVATVETAWTTQPDSTSEYLVLGRIG